MRGRPAPAARAPGGSCTNQETRPTRVAPTVRGERCRSPGRAAPDRPDGDCGAVGPCLGAVGWGSGEAGTATNALALLRRLQNDGHLKNQARAPRQGSSVPTGAPFPSTPRVLAMPAWGSGVSRPRPPFPSHPCPRAGVSRGGELAWSLGRLIVIKKGHGDLGDLESMLGPRDAEWPGGGRGTQQARTKAPGPDGPEGPGSLPPRRPSHVDWPVRSSQEAARARAQFRPWTYVDG